MAQAAITSLKIVADPGSARNSRRTSLARVKLAAVNARALRENCLSLTGAAETFPFGPETSVFKVSGKMFALSRLGGAPLQISLKCEPELAEQLRATHDAVLPGYHLNKRHWNTVTVDGSLSDQMIKDMIEDSYDLVVSCLPRARQESLGWRSDVVERTRERAAPVERSGASS